ncbi:NUDIX domain-containing protein [Mycobacterium sp. 88mf]|nr:NUDIX domain-containing protein [Mycobacterium sp. 88mf]SFF59916.1 NUDIX domain-containing protein [Mycobacterium sp. 455mf]
MGTATRDRDDSGRPRSTRPRDALGRPLPYGSEGVARIPDDLELSPAETLAYAQDLLDRGQAFSAHEVLEAAWKNGPEHERGLWQGLAQLAVGITHVQRGNLAGAGALLRRASARLSLVDLPAPYGIDVAHLVAFAATLADEIDEGDVEADRLHLRLRADTIRQIATREVYRNNWLTLREDDIVRPDGSTGVYAVVDKPTYALVIPYDPAQDRFHLVEQFRYPLGLRRWEFPQGTAPEQEHLDPTALAHRELREETGLRAERMERLGQLDVAAGMSSQRGWVFLATGLTEGQHEREHEEQDMHSAWFSRAELDRMIRDGDITDAQSLAALTFLLLRESGFQR